MEYLPFSFIAGLLTVIAPCVFTLLPVILSGSLQSNNWKRPLLIISSLSISVLLFTLVLKASTVFISIPQSFWNWFSGGILIIFGFVTIFPAVWTAISVKLKLSQSSEQVLHEASQKQGITRDIMIGFALGPVFSSCSPTYGIIIATVLPQSFWIGFLNLIAYVIGLALILSLIAFFGQNIVSRLKWAVDPKGPFKRILGTILVFVGVLILTGLDKDLETYLLDQGLFDPTNIELNLLDSNKKNSVEDTDINLSIEKPYAAPEITGISDWINTDGEKLEDLKGKVVLIDFWTYSCINCIRTVPFVQEWYDKYEDDGLVVIGLHAPEFAFERELTNVENAVEEYGISYPVGLDNDYATWQAFENQFWPAHYFIDRDGNVVHTHFGEGEYDESERIIRYLLGLDTEEVDNEDVVPPISNLQTPETYLGYQRGQSFVNATEFVADKASNYSGSNELSSNFWSLEGMWLITGESAISKQDNATLKHSYSGADVYLVMGSEVNGARVKVDTESGVRLGPDVSEDGYVYLNGYRIYHLVANEEVVTDSTLELIFDTDVEANAFTFGS